MDDFERWRHEVDRRLDALENKGKRKQPDGTNARAINILEVDQVVDGETVIFTGKAFYAAQKGPKWSVGIGPIDSRKGDTTGRFFEWWGKDMPEWFMTGLIVEVVAQLKLSPKQDGSGAWRNFKIIKWKSVGDSHAKPQQYADPAMQAQAPLDISGEPVTRTQEYIDQGGIRQTFVSDEEAGVDPESIPF